MLCFHAAQTGKHLLRIQNVSEQNQKKFLCSGHKICVCNKCCAHGQTGKHLCWQQCVRSNVSSSTMALKASQFIKVVVCLIGSIICCLVETLYWISKKTQGRIFLITWSSGSIHVLLRCWSFESKADFFVSLVFTKRYQLC